MKYFILLIMLCSFAYSIELDPYLIEHSIYAEKGLSVNNESSLPKSGIIATDIFAFTDANSSNLRTTMNARIVTGNENVNLADGSNIGGMFQPDTVKPLQHAAWPGIKVNDNGVLNYIRNLKGQAPYTVNAGVINNVTAIQTPPQMPDLSGIVFNGGSNVANNARLTGGHYGNLNVSCILEAGTYYFDEINLPSGGEISIEPSGDSYTTTIYVKNHINLGTSASIRPNHKDGEGHVLIVLRGDEPEVKIDNLHVDGTLYARDKAKIVATLLAPTSRILFRNEASVRGQVFGEMVHFIGFDGMNDLIYIPIKTSKVELTKDVYREDDGVTSIDVTLLKDNVDSTGIIEYLLESGSATIGSDMTFTSVRGKFEYNVGSKVSITQIPMTIIDDLDFEGDEIFLLHLFNSTSNIDLGGDTATYNITIIDNDPENAHPPVVVSDTLTCMENGSVTATPKVTDLDN